MPQKKKAPEFKAYKRRRWLNAASKGGTAFVNAKVEEIHSRWGEHPPVIGTLEIADCSRVVSLEFDDADGDLTHAMKKIDVLMTALCEFRDKLQDAFEAAKRSTAAARAAEKKKQ